MGDEEGQVRFTAFCQMNFEADPRRASLLAVVSQITRRESRWSERGEEYSQRNANEPHRQCADNFAPTLVGATPLPEHGGATQVLLDQTGHQAALFLAVRCLRRKPDARLPPKANANLRGVCHSGPPTLLGCEHASSLEQPPQDY